MAASTSTSSRSILVSGIPPQTTFQEMVDLFSHCGELECVALKPPRAAKENADKITDNNKTRTAIIKFQDPDFARTALLLNEVTLHDHVLQIVEIPDEPEENEGVTIIPRPVRMAAATVGGAVEAVVHKGSDAANFATIKARQSAAKGMAMGNSAADWVKHAGEDVGRRKTEMREKAAHQMNALQSALDSSTEAIQHMMRSAKDQFTHLTRSFSSGNTEIYQPTPEFLAAAAADAPDPVYTLDTVQQ